MSTPEMTDFTFIGTPEDMRAKGLLGFLSFTLNGLVAIQNVTLRRLPDGALVLRYPSRRSPCGHQIDYVAPANDGVGRAIELQVLAALSMEVKS